MKMIFEPNLSEILQCARICHEVNRAYCFTLGDATQTHWINAPEWQRETVITGVKAHIASGLTMTAEGSHRSWMAEKKREGWKYGPEKDVDRKTHPCFMSYASLPHDQRTKDWLFRAAVHAFFHQHFEA